MANIIGYLTAALLAVSAFFAIKNKGALAQYAKDSNSSKGDIEESTRTLEETRTMVTGLKSDFENSSSASEELKAEIEKTNASLSELDEKIEQAENVETEKQQEVASAEEDLDKLDEVGFLLQNLKKQQRELAESQDKVATLEAKLASSTAAVKTAEKSIEGIRAENQGLTNSSLSTSIRTTVPGWGFVILNGGDAAGISSGSTLQVVRAGKVIAKLLVTTVEANTASADIIPGTLKRGFSLRSGDRVVSAEASKGA